MGMRTAVKPGSVIKMPNHGQYIVGENIGEGGLSLIYSAKTKNNHFPVIIKEFFPAEHAHRADKTIRGDDGAIIEVKGRVYPDAGYAERFDRCLKAFAQEGQLGSSARMHNFQIISFSDCGDGYAVLPRWSNDCCSFSDLADRWLDAPPPSNDRVFPDLGRIRFSLTAIRSLLSVVSSIHGQNMLHLDISASNVVWAGRSHISAENGAAFLTDFGCSVFMSDRAYPAECVLSYSRAYAAPEYLLEDGQLTPATDIYSVGRLLAFLCFGRRAFCDHYRPEDLVSRLHIPPRHRHSLLTIIRKATEEDMAARYQSAAEMQEAVCELLSAIPAHPINPDNSAAFSLYSLKSMLEGSLDTHYSWAHELCDRRSVSMTLPEQVHQPVARLPGGHFKDDVSFLRTVLPEAVFRYLWEQISKEADPQHAVSSIMSGNYPADWKREISNKLAERWDLLPELFARCGKMLHSAHALKGNIRFLFRVPGDDISYFERCYQECAFALADDLRKGLALLVIFALLGQGECGFEAFAQHSPSEIRKLLQR